MPRTRGTIKSLLVLGEGPCDTAFGKYLHSQYIVRGAVSPKHYSLDGGGGDETVSKALRYDIESYDRAILLLDTDVPANAELISLAEARGIKFILSTPCLEGLFLKVLGKSVPGNCDDCKNQWLPMVNNMSVPDAYEFGKKMPKSRLDKERGNIRELNDLISAFEV